MQKFIVIPTYQPDEMLIKLLETIPRTYQVVVVDDGSGEEYTELFNNNVDNNIVASLENFFIC